MHVRVRADQRVLAGEVEVVADDHERPGTERRVEAARGIGQDHDARPEALEQQHRLDDEPGRVALVEVEAALEHDHRPCRRGSRAAAARRGREPSRRASPGKLGEGDGDRVLELVGEPAESRSEHDPELGHEVRPGAHGRGEGSRAGRAGRRVGSVSRGPRRQASAGSGWRLGVGAGPSGHRAAGRQSFVQGSTAGGPRDFCGPDGSTDTGMPVASRRADPGTAQERRRDRVQKRPKRPALAGGPLM